MDKLLPYAYIVCQVGCRAPDDCEEYEEIMTAEDLNAMPDKQKYIDHGMCAPLYEIPEGFALVESGLTDRVALDAHDNAYGALQEHEQSLGRTTDKNRRTAEEYESQIVDAAKLILMIKAGSK